MLKIYGIKNCSSMKKAFDLLDTLGLSYEFHDYKKQSIDAQHLKQWLDTVGAEVILNKKGTTWRKLDEQAQQTALASQTALIEALMTHTSMIKRPVLETPNGLIVGFDEEKYRALTN
ncbi:Spx/MgsR family RNA polymerase-binding regulatory protein [Acinetobacter rathckeae]|uniref:Spx/MgsR family RNA polymerase-binding regulatory protein n=1 Tax=Acinetobacter rathckeae TaxID=2605272 RepID=UPI0018A290A7|nr:Spx/MgsR family RNA polymerase-binding regulatory protein [Acinetobacter rathckeae]MBF7688249.1 Spx/MgsR family RNA polymerase-binding regulatory protein [Acinetobacter rathckeae]MBF7695233.1 Spx/MgsR family RNA polymerase-binding regulatory protein [Acinetobacter rathckeae]